MPNNLFNLREKISYYLNFKIKLYLLPDSTTSLDDRIMKNKKLLMSQYICNTITGFNMFKSC